MEKASALPSSILVYEEREVIDRSLEVFAGHNFDLLDSTLPGDVLGSIAAKLFQCCCGILRHDDKLGRWQNTVNGATI